MDDETLQLTLTILQIMGKEATPFQVEFEYIKAGQVIHEYRQHLKLHPEDDPRTT